MSSVKNTIPISEARKRIFAIAREVQVPNRVYTLTEKGRPKAVIMSAEEYESMVETMEVSRLFPDLDKDIAETRKAIRTGEYKKWPTLKDLERDWGFASEKPKRKYGVRSYSKTK